MPVEAQKKALGSQLLRQPPLFLMGTEAKQQKRAGFWPLFLAYGGSFQVLVGANFPGDEQQVLGSSRSPSSAGPSPRLPEQRVRPGLDFWQSPREGEKTNSPLPAGTQHPGHRAGCSPACSQMPNLPRLNGEETASKNHQQAQKSFCSRQTQKIQHMFPTLKPNQGVACAPSYPNSKIIPFEGKG